MTLTKLSPFFSPSVIAAMALCGQAHAQDAPPAAPPATPAPVSAVPAALPQVEIGASRGDERRASGTFRQTVGAAELVRYGDGSVLDVLRRQPGIVVNGVPGRKGGEVSMRGLGSGYVRILLNGEPAPPHFMLDNLAPDVVERIEILAVPTVEMGTQAIAGTINLILKRSNGKQQRQLRAGIYHDNDRTKPQLSSTWSGQDDTLSWLVTAATRQLSGDETYLTRTEGAGEEGAILREMKQFNEDRGWNWSLAPRISKKFGADESLALQSYLSGLRYDSAGFGRTDFLRGPETDYANENYTSAGSSLTIRNNLTWIKTLGASSKLEAKAGATYGRSEASSGIDFVDRGQRLRNRQDTANDQHNRSLTASAKLRTAYTDKHAFVSGVELQRDRDQYHRSDVIDARSRLDQAGTAFRVDSRRYALYAQDEWDVTARVAVYLGLRWERVELDSANNLGQRVDFARGMFSPVLQSVWRLPGTKSDQVRLGLARTWRVPASESLIAGRRMSVANTVTRPDTSGNPDVRPERALGLDLAYEHYLSQDGMVGVGLFTRRIDDVTLTRTVREGERWVARPFNSGRALARGITLETKFKLPQLLAGAPALDVRASLARTWSALDAVPGPDNRIGNQAPLSVNVGADYTFSSVPVSAGATLAYARNGTVRLSGYETSSESNKRGLEGYVLWKFTPKMHLRLSASNLLHEDDLKRASYAGEALWQTKTVTAPTYMVLRAIAELKF
ncbi:TonB-dependent receptor plug domain-containing protein [Massilia sp. CCM 8733]|uniref:TonB-dependent receptor plug domain-containing protein n=1 Tax=Massilia mucilaginosa TaxID=2609282 RepID=A0ABX0P0Z6_9BURK|nr:TonB-dependent receptor [Massilia mucilaginosa]NHZ92729.1 TonB-dependent receptor plug domain-containing protein [Massilia mucilaginosa]